MILLVLICLLPATSHAKVNCPEYCKTVDDNYCFCESGYGEYGGKKEIRSLVTFETHAPIVRWINVCKPLEDAIGGIVTADKTGGKREQVGKILSRILKKMLGFKCLEKPHKAEKRPMEKAAWIKKLYHIHLFNSNRYASLIQKGRKTKDDRKGGHTLHVRRIDYRHKVKKVQY